MATTSFTKNFCVSAGKSAEFVTHMTKNTKQVLPRDLNLNMSTHITIGKHCNGFLVSERVYHIFFRRFNKRWLY